MAQKLIQTEIQKQQMLQRLSAQQMLQVRLLEMPLSELEQDINAQIDDNPALEKASESTDSNNEDNNYEDDITGDNADANSDETEYEREEKEDALDSALEDIGRDDQMPEYESHSSNNNADYEEIVYGDTRSFYDSLKEQMDMLTLTPKEHDIMEYLIGSIDNDGILRKDLDTICDELAIYHNVDCTTEEIENVLKKLQTFDPAGIGARSLQECLVLQEKRRPAGKLRDRMITLLNDHFDDLMKNHWDKITQSMALSSDQTAEMREELKKLNPKPGASLGETQGRNLQQITPDFVVDTDDDGTLTLSINKGDIPELKVSRSFSDMIDTYKKNKKNMNRQDKEALLYAKEKVDKAQGYIEAIRQRQQTMYATMHAIMNWQRKFFQTGDEADLKPMKLKDIADKTGYDMSTISRVGNIKYVQTRWGIFPLKFFFTDGYTTKDGEELSTRKIKLALKDIIDKEDKSKPLSDDVLTAEMKKKGFPIARRTVAKYREQMNIPIARLRKQ